MNIEILFSYSGTYAFIINQIAAATITTTIAPHTTGADFFELPLRGESFGAWLYRSSIAAWPRSNRR
jgi:hypothetical protein